MRNIILFGEVGAGKDTVADYLVEHHHCAKKKLGRYIHHAVDAFSYKENFDKRCAMQDFGQSMRKIFGDDVWNEALWRDMCPQQVPFVIADGRQINEYHYWTGKGFLAIGITASPEVRAKRLLERDGVDQSHRFNHETEEQARYVINNFCRAVIHNEFDRIEDLYETVDFMLEKY